MNRLLTILTLIGDRDIPVTLPSRRRQLHPRYPTDPVGPVFQMSRT